MTCSLVNFPNGMNKDCIKALKEAKAALVFKADNSTFDNKNALDNVENMRVKIQETEVLAIIQLQGSEVTPGEIQEATTGYGDTFPNGVNAPMVIGHAKTNACDFLEYLKAFGGGTYEVMFLDADNNIMAYNNGSDILGFQTSIQAQPFGIGAREGQEAQYQIKFYFREADQFKSYIVTPVNYTLNELLLLAPVGLSLFEATAYDTGTGIIVMDVEKRCTGVEETGTLTGEVIKTNSASAVTVTPAYDAVDENYDVTVAAGAGQLAAGEYAIFRLVEKSGSVYDKVSDHYKVTG
jgi:hypothetical protein